MLSRDLLVLRLACMFFVLPILFVTYRMFVPWLVNLHNDGALLLAAVLGIGVPTALLFGLYLVWTETFE